MSKGLRTWLHSLVAALISGAATGLSAAVVAPGVSAGDLAKMSLVSAAVGVGLFLKQSPLPPDEAP